MCFYYLVTLSNSPPNGSQQCLPYNSQTECFVEFSVFSTFLDSLSHLTYQTNWLCNSENMEMMMEYICFSTQFIIFKNYIFPLFTFQMLSPFLVSPLKILYPLPSPPASQPTHSHSWSWHSPILGHRAFTGPRVSPPIDDRLCHPLLHI